MNRLLYILLSFLILTTASAQSRKDKAIFKLAHSEYKQLRYAYAIPIFKSFLVKYPKDTAALKELSFSYQKVNQLDSAVHYFEKAVNAEVIKTQFLAELYASTGNYDKAKDLYKTLVDSNITKIAEARLYGFTNINKMLSDSLDYKLFNTKLNTGYNEYNGTLYKNGIVFESNRINQVIKPKGFFKRIFKGTPRPAEFAWDGAGYSKLYYYPNIDSVRMDSNIISSWSEKNSKKNYTDYSVSTPNDTKKIPSKFDLKIKSFDPNGVTSFEDFISDKMNIGAISFTADGRSAYYTRNQKKSNSIYQLEVWEVYNKNGKWVGAHKMFFNNSKFSFFHPAVTPDGKRLYYVSDDNSGQGGTDIYYIDKNDDGSWKNTVNLGQDINTAGNELFPTFYEGNLFISSNGHPGLGGLDIYRLTKNNKGEAELKNMGYPINSSKDDFAFSITGSKGFFSTNRYGTDDILAFNYNQTFIKMKGQILFDSICIAGKTVYMYQNNAVGKPIIKDSAIVDANCYYEFNVRPNQQYELVTFDNAGKKFSQTLISGDYNRLDSSYVKEVALINIPLDQKIKAATQLVKEAELAKMTPKFRLAIDSLKSITKSYVELHHPFDQVYIVEKDLADYYKIIELVKRTHNKKIVIVSAADCNGSIEYNEDLATRRANRIYRTLSKLSNNEIVIKQVGERELLKACDDLKKSVEDNLVNRYSYVFIMDKN